MIGVCARPADMPVARELFELFKTPWEPAVPGRQYDVLLDTVGVTTFPASLCLAYGSGSHAVDALSGVERVRIHAPVRSDWQGVAFPIYGNATAFRGTGTVGDLATGGQRLQYRHDREGSVVWRIGYDLFSEVRELLTVGQPVSFAETPTLDRHIALLRTLIIDSGVAVVEVPPQPAGYDFTCCLTHDIDFAGLRRHWADRTLAGFALRATLGTLADCLRGRRPVADLLRNGAALARLPLVLAGVRPDPWRPFEDYERADGNRPSTFFVIPFKGRPGLAPDGTVRARRAAPYDLAELQDELCTAIGREREIAVHGIDAWREAGAGEAEKARVTEVTGRPSDGVRMHWLYFDQASPRALEAAGFGYDSTWGYNDAIGYRAGTSQVFRFPECRNLLELPLSIMDTAMFYADRMSLSWPAAADSCQAIVQHAVGTGGTVVINWHDRSLAPERLWGARYAALLDLVGDRAWFATAADAVRWYRWRRSIRFDAAEGGVTVTVGAPPADLPGGRLVVHQRGCATRPHETPLSAAVTLSL